VFLGIRLHPKTSDSLRLRNPVFYPKILAVGQTCRQSTSALDVSPQTLQSRVLFANAEHIKAIDYVQANRQRTRSIGILKRVFDEVDVIVTPTTAHCAPPIVESELKYGALNANQDLKNMRLVWVEKMLAFLLTKWRRSTLLTEA